MCQALVEAISAPDIALRLSLGERFAFTFRDSEGGQCWSPFTSRPDLDLPVSTPRHLLQLNK